MAGLQGETGPVVIFVDYSTAFGLYGHQPATHSLVHFLGQGTAPRQPTCPPNQGTADENVSGVGESHPRVGTGTVYDN